MTCELGLKFCGLGIGILWIGDRKLWEDVCVHHNSLYLTWYRYYGVVSQNLCYEIL